MDDFNQLLRLDDCFNDPRVVFGPHKGMIDDNRAALSGHVLGYLSTQSKGINQSGAGGCTDWFCPGFSRGGAEGVNQCSVYRFAPQRSANN